ncbi:MAG TPA: hypothetical protein VKV57_01450 [bacterium]|nr:hypothetical protein [bacterium]
MSNVRGAAHCFPTEGTPISRCRAIGLIGSLAAIATAHSIVRPAWAVSGVGWTQWAQVPTIPRLTFSPAAAAYRGGTGGGSYMWVYGVRADDFSLSYAEWNGRQWGSWQSLGGKWTSSPGACVTEVGGHLVYCRDVDNATYQNNGHPRIGTVSGKRDRLTLVEA